MPLGEGEKILVIEDDPDVRTLVVAILESLDYEVVAKNDAHDARAYLASQGAVDLILSDIILPGGLSGPEFAARERERDPFIKIVFMSGYPADPAGDDGAPESEIPTLYKPFEPSDLAVTLRLVLDGVP